jgi:hypothetical protein
VLRGSPTPGLGAEPLLKVCVNWPKLELENVAVGFA